MTAAPLGRLAAPGPDTPGLLAAANPRIAVLGDALLDGWWHGSTRRLCREAPAPVVELDDQRAAPGGAANTALNAAQLGARVSFWGIVGDDREGVRLRELLSAGGVDCENLIGAEGATTTTKSRVLAGDQIIVRVDSIADAPPPAARQALAARIEAALDDIDAVIICDYGIGVLDGAVREALTETLQPGGADSADSASRRRPLVIVDAHEPERWHELHPDLVTPNEQEARRMLDAGQSGGVQVTAGRSDGRAGFMHDHREQLLAASGAGCVVVTMDADGTLALPGPGFPLGDEHRTWARPVTEKQASGAGDTFVAALGVGLAAGLQAAAALNLAQSAADVAVHCPGTAVCSTADLEAYLSGLACEVVDLDLLAHRVRQYRAEGKRIVLTNGCFDVLHRGHTRLLEQARQLGDVLIVAINDDASARRLKGPGRPINPAADRAAVLAALGGVDHVTIFASDTAVEVVQRLRPDVYAKGGDHSAETLAERPAVEAYGGTVLILDYVPDHSTTEVVERIRGSQTALVPAHLAEQGGQ